MTHELLRPNLANSEALNAQECPSATKIRERTAHQKGILMCKIQYKMHIATRTYSIAGAPKMERKIGQSAVCIVKYNTKVTLVPTCLTPGDHFQTLK